MSFLDYTNLNISTCDERMRKKIVTFYLNNNNFEISKKNFFFFFFLRNKQREERTEITRKTHYKVEIPCKKKKTKKNQGNI